MSSQYSSFDLPSNCSEITVSEPIEVKIAASVDDEAFAIGDFVQKMMSLLDAEFQKFFEANKDKITGLSEEEKHDWLFDYIWNGWSEDSEGFELTFSETMAECQSYIIK